MTTEEIAQIAALIAATLHNKQDTATDDKISRLTNIVDTLASSVIGHDGQIEAHDRQIEALNRQIEARDRQLEARDRQLDKLIAVTEQHGRQIADLSREWQAYLRRVLPQ